MNWEQLSISAALLWGIILDSVAAPAAGLYFTALAVSLGAFYRLPFTFSWINAVLAVVAGLAVFFILIISYSGWVAPAPKFAAHAVFYLSTAVAALYVFHKKKK